MPEQLTVYIVEDDASVRDSLALMLGLAGYRVALYADAEAFLTLLNPFAPHVTEELWERRDHVETLLEAEWPGWDEAKIRRSRITLVVQVDGKLRDRVEVPADADDGEVRAAALASDKVREHLGGRELAKAVVVPGRLVNLVTRKTA